MFTYLLGATDRILKTGDRFSVSSQHPRYAFEYFISEKVCVDMDSTSENKNPSVSKKITRKCLTYDEKVQILKKLDEGKTQQAVADLFGVARTTICGIVKQRDVIQKRHNILLKKNPAYALKKYKAVEESRMEKILFAWLSHFRETGLTIQGPQLQEHALKISAILGDTEFVASNGWLYNFRKRFGIRIEDNKRSNLKASKKFSEEFQEYIVSEGLTSDQIYSADATGLLWKELPRKTCDENSAEGSKDTKERVTVMACANASGTHKIPLSVIGKQDQPNCFDGTLPSFYIYQKNARMDVNVFRLWFTCVFIPAIKQHHHQEKVLLLLNNIPFFPTASEMNSINPGCMVKYIPQNMSVFIHPMDKGIISTIKRCYKTAYLREFFLVEGSDVNEKYVTFLKNWELLVCMKTLSTVWANIHVSNLRSAWINLLGDKEIYVHAADNNREITDMISSALQSTLSLEETNNWLQCDKAEQGWEIQSIQEFATAIQSKPASIEREENEKSQNTEETTLSINVNVEKICAKEAYRSINKAYDWLISRSDTTTQDLDSLAICKEKITAIYAAEKLIKL